MKLNITWRKHAIEEWARFRKWKVTNCVRNWLLRRYLVSSYPLIVFAMLAGGAIWPTWGGMMLGGVISLLVIVPLSVTDANRRS